MVWNPSSSDQGLVERVRRSPRRFDQPVALQHLQRDGDASPADRVHGRQKPMRDPETFAVDPVVGVNDGAPCSVRDLTDN